jgi:hypothetical protein
LVVCCYHLIEALGFSIDDGRSLVDVFSICLIIQNHSKSIRLIILFAIQVIFRCGVMKCLIAIAILKIAEPDFYLEHGINPTVEGIEE